MSTVSVVKKCSHVLCINAGHVYLLGFYKTAAEEKVFPVTGQHLDLAELCSSRFKGHQCFFCFSFYLAKQHCINCADTQQLTVLDADTLSAAN